MATHALAERELLLFLRRRRRQPLVEVPLLGRFLAETLEMTANLVPSEADSLLLDDPTLPRAKSPLTFVAAFGTTAARLIGQKVTGEGVIGRVYRTGETVATPVRAGDAERSLVVDRSGKFRTRSLVATPIHLEHTVCGVLELVNRKGKREYSPHDVELAELIAGYVSRAILNAVDVVKQNELALRDELTGLGNVRGLDPMLVDEVRRADKRRGDVAVIFVDVDRLKALNDSLGHRAGSEALRRLGKVLSTSLGDRGRAFRFGGDEFVIVCPRHDMATAEALAEELRGAIAKGTRGPMRLGGQLPALHVSVGIATLRDSLAARPPRDAGSLAERLLAAADHALYRAKRAGRDRVARANRRDDRLVYEG